MVAAKVAWKVFLTADKKAAWLAAKRAAVMAEMLAECWGILSAAQRAALMAAALEYHWVVLLGFLMAAYSAVLLAAEKAGRLEVSMAEW